MTDDSPSLPLVNNSVNLWATNASTYLLSFGAASHLFPVCQCLPKSILCKLCKSWQEIHLLLRLNIVHVQNTIYATQYMQFSLSSQPAANWLCQIKRAKKKKRAWWIHIWIHTWVRSLIHITLLKMNQINNSPKFGHHVHLVIKLYLH